jgi:hypothetical protein
VGGAWPGNTLEEGAGFIQKMGERAMKRLTIIVCLLSVCLMAIAQPAQQFNGEKLEYQLSWSLLPFLKAGEAFLWCEPDEQGGIVLSFHGYSTGLAKEFYNADNLSRVTLDNQGFVRQIYHRLTDQSEERWLPDYPRQLIYHYLADCLADTLPMERNPSDALSTIYLLRKHQLGLEYRLDLEIIGHDSLGRSAWKPARVTVDSLWQEVKVLGNKQKCLVINITLDPKDNLFPGGKIKLWVTADSLQIPVKAETDFHLLGFIPSKVKAQLIKRTKKGD